MKAVLGGGAGNRASDELFELAWCAWLLLGNPTARAGQVFWGKRRSYELQGERGRRDG